MSETEGIHPGFAVGGGSILVGTVLEALAVYQPFGFILVLLGALFLIEGEFRR